MGEIQPVPREKPPDEIERGWEGFPDRLQLAVTTRARERGITMRKIARSANYDESNLAKILADKPARWLGLQANSLLAFARVLDVRPLWLLTGQEPSGLATRAELPAIDQERFERDAKKLSEPAIPQLSERAGK